MEQEQKEIQLSVDKIIDIIRTERSNLIKDFLDEQQIVAYFYSRFNKKLSRIKIEFLQKELKELLISPVDLVHYASLINLVRETGSASLAQGNKEIFYQELEQIFRKYNF